MKYNFLNILGLMTGTSMDGIDISLVKTNGLDLIRLNQNYYHEYDSGIKRKLTEILNGDVELNIKIREYLDELIAHEHYLALKNLNIVEKCDLIGFHGQTIYHNPDNKVSIQLGNPKILAEKLKKDVVFDFRSNDLIFGGQGAPLAPIYHKFIIEKLNLNLPTCILNIGGVSNLTYWDGDHLMGFDTGPGNALMDDYAYRVFKKNFDKNGKYASKGIPIEKEIKEFLKHDFFKKIPPKSLDRLSFKSNYLNLIKKKYSIYDTMATLAEFTVESIVSGLKILPKEVHNIVITGGGYKNLNLLSRLRDKLRLNFLKENELGLEFDYIESELIAYLSARSIYKLPFTFPSTTGVKKPLSGGILYKTL